MWGLSAVFKNKIYIFRSQNVLLMQLTGEQQEIIKAKGDLKINAVAGSGKTTTIIAFARSLPATARILYLAFNRSVKLEATAKFSNQGLRNVSVETAHSLAFRYVMPKHNYQLKNHGYKTHEIAELLGLQGGGEKHGEFIAARHINQFVSYFCNSNKAKVNELKYYETLSDPKSRAFVKTNYAYILRQTRLLLAKMDKGTIEIIHDFYLKKFQLGNPILPYDYILFDEGQDASAAMLDIFQKQKARKVIVGDTHQQIYGWRYAVNSLQQLDYKNYYLTTSFRFPQEIADLGIAVLTMKKLLGEEPGIKITGKGKSKNIKSRAILARTNLGLLLRAIEYMNHSQVPITIYFEGNINSYTYADDGTSLYDVLSLYNKKHRMIRDQLIKKMKGMEELEEYVKNAEDVQLGMMVEIVKKYGNEIPDIIQDLKACHIEDGNKDNADIVFSTVHRCKGMEYDEITLVNDFINKSKIEKLLNDNKNKKNDQLMQKLNEEINLLYVAVTRAQNKIVIPSTLVPEGFNAAQHVEIVEVKEEEDFDEEMELLDKWDMDKNVQDYYHINAKRTLEDVITSSREKQKELPRNAYNPWTAEDDEALTVMYCEGKSAKDIAKNFNRTTGAIRSRIKKLELKDLYS